MMEAWEALGLKRPGLSDRVLVQLLSLSILSESGHMLLAYFYRDVRVALCTLVKCHYAEWQPL